MLEKDWLSELATQAELADLLAPSTECQEAAGYGHTLAEICQQPHTWLQTADGLIEARAWLQDWMDGVQWLVLTGSGSSQYVGECVHPVLQPEMGRPVVTLGGGWLLIDGARCVPPARPGLLVSLARSGDSPESVGVVEAFLEAEPLIKHLVITCNPQGRLAMDFTGDRRVRRLTLDSRTNDRSLVMTSSFTNMAIASRALSLLGDAEAIRRLADQLARAARSILLRYADVLAAVARAPFKKAVFLGTGCQFGAAKESALKMLEMNSGRIPTVAETFLGLRHGPMCGVDRDTLAVCFLSSDPLARAYEEDLLAELNRKDLGARKLLIGAEIRPALLTGGDVAVRIPEMAAAGDVNSPVLAVLVGQLLAFFRCRAEGLRPDNPSTGAISRVVNGFPIYREKSAKENAVHPGLKPWAAD